MVTVMLNGLDRIERGRKTQSPGTQSLFNLDASLFVALGVLVVWIPWVATTSQHIGRGHPNMEATWHSILTIRSLMELPLSETFGLPSVTLPGEANRGVLWGATVPTSQGVQIYTSFPPLGWLLPSAVFSMLGVDPSEASLFSFNAVLAGLTSLCLSSTVLRVARVAQTSTAFLTALSTTLLYLFSSENLLSHSILYWPHALLQLILAGALLVVARILDGHHGRMEFVLLTALVILSVYTEWSALLFAIALCAFFAIRARIAEHKSRKFLLAALSATAVALTGLVFHFVLALGFAHATFAWRTRFIARSLAGGSGLDQLAAYARGWAMSLGLTAIVILLAFLIFRSASLQATTSLSWILVLSISPSLTNFVLLQHATQFSFD